MNAFHKGARKFPPCLWRGRDFLHFSRPHTTAVDPYAFHCVHGAHVVAARYLHELCVARVYISADGRLRAVDAVARECGRMRRGEETHIADVCVCVGVCACVCVLERESVCTSYQTGTLRLPAPQAADMRDGGSQASLPDCIPLHARSDWPAEPTLLSPVRFPDDRTCMDYRVLGAGVGSGPCHAEREDQIVPTLRCRRAGADSLGQSSALHACFGRRDLNEHTALLTSRILANGRREGFVIDGEDPAGINVHEQNYTVLDASAAAPRVGIHTARCCSSSANAGSLAMDAFAGRRPRCVERRDGARTGARTRPQDGAGHEPSGE